MKATLPLDEETRLEALYRYRILDTVTEDVYDTITRLSTHLCGVPIAAITLVDEDREWFKSRVGLDSAQVSRDHSFGAHAILVHGVTMVPDLSEDPRFSDNPQVTSDPPLRFYAGAPLVTPEGHVIGTLCVMDRKPRNLTPEQTEVLHALSRHTICQIEMRHSVSRQALVLASLEQAWQDFETASVDEADRANDDYQAIRAKAATYIFETVPHKAYFSSDAALARFYGYQTFEELTALLSDI